MDGKGITSRSQSLAGTIRDLQKENRCLLMEMDEIYFKNQELSGLLEKALHPVQHTVITTGNCNSTVNLHKEK